MLSFTGVRPPLREEQKFLERRLGIRACGCYPAHAYLKSKMRNSAGFQMQKAVQYRAAFVSSAAFLLATACATGCLKRKNLSVFSKLNQGDASADAKALGQIVLANHAGGRAGLAHQNFAFFLYNLHVGQ